MPDLFQWYNLNLRYKSTESVTGIHAPSLHFRVTYHAYPPTTDLSFLSQRSTHPILHGRWSCHPDYRTFRGVNGQTDTEGRTLKRTDNRTQTLRSKPEPLTLFQLLRHVILRCICSCIRFRNNKCPCYNQPHYAPESQSKIEPVVEIESNVKDQYWSDPATLLRLWKLATPFIIHTHSNYPGVVYRGLPLASYL